MAPRFDWRESPQGYSSRPYGSSFKSIAQNLEISERTLQLLVLFGAAQTNSPTHTARRWSRWSAPAQSADYTW